MKFNVPSPKLNVVFEAVTFADLREAYVKDGVTSANSLAREVGLSRLDERRNFKRPHGWEVRTHWDDKSGRYIVIATWITWEKDGE